MELGRFFQACAAYQSFCQFGGADPWAAFDKLVSDASIVPIPVPATPTQTDPRPVDGDDVNAAAAIAMYSKRSWAALAGALSMASKGDGSGIRSLADGFWGRNRRRDVRSGR